jgi:hypothetical protein
MQVYDAPLRDMRFVLHEMAAGDGFGATPRWKSSSPIWPMPCWRKPRAFRARCWRR